MATLVLSAVGASLGGALGAGTLGLVGTAVGQAAGAAIGRSVDQRLLGTGSEAVEVGRVDRFRLMGASEGTAIPRVWGRFRIGGQVIWASRFREERRRKSSGKGGGRKASVTEYSYTVSLAVALCEGPITCIGRVWADGNEIAPSSLTMRVYEGSEEQLPDPLIEATEGAGNAFACRGVAYVVIEDLDLGRFGNRVPQFSFEVVRSASKGTGLASTVRGVALIPGTGEYSLATSVVKMDGPPGARRAANAHTGSGASDFTASLVQLRAELPAVKAVSLVVSWFGSDLRCSSCRIRPKVEQTSKDGRSMPWRSGGIDRGQAEVVARQSGKSVYGGTPCDQSVIEAVRAIRSGGESVMFYPFVLMDQLEGNGKPNPWLDGTEQPKLPWRGRITLEVAPGRPGSSDRTGVATGEVSAFFGSATRSDFDVVGGRIVYSGPDDWGYRRFILHNAYLCSLAGGVDAFCIGSELRGLTCIRDSEDRFPAVEQLIALADDVRMILGPKTKIGYAADWSEYASYQADGNLYFHLDRLWAHPNIDFVGMDNYFPLSDWRESESNTDEGWGRCTNIDYLTSNVAGGEWFDWYYDSAEGAENQRRVPIKDDLRGEDWAYRAKDIRGWWENEHQDRIDGEFRNTGWVPQMKPVWFTEYGCPAVDKGTNQPNVFVDPKSSESALPRGSNGVRDDFVQVQYYRAVLDYWSRTENNPTSTLYGGAMVDMSRAFAWAWDARPFPVFPSQTGIWDDGVNYDLGHWLNGRSASQTAEDIVRDLAGTEVGTLWVDVPAVIRGYAIDKLSTPRSALQPLALALGFDVIERDGGIQVKARDAKSRLTLDPGEAVLENELGGQVEHGLSGADTSPKMLVVGFVRDQGGFEAASMQSLHGLVDSVDLSQSELPLLMTNHEARQVVERWHTETALARTTVRLALPPSRSGVASGDNVTLGNAVFRVDRVERSSHLLVEAVRTDPSAFAPAPSAENDPPSLAIDEAAEIATQFLDLPLVTGDEVPHAPHVAVSAWPWPGPVAVWDAVGEDGFELNTVLATPAVIGVTESSLLAARPGLPDRGEPLRVSFGIGDISGADWAAVLDGANLIAIGSGASSGWELLQFSTAELVDADTFELSGRLRGQFGTDGDMPEAWPPGSMVVLLDDALRQIVVPAGLRNLARTYRVGRAALGYGDEEAETRIEAFRGIGLRPYPVAHLTARREPGGSVLVEWVRRTRIDGDSWESVEVPLGEDSEWYVVRIQAGSTVLREVRVDRPEWTYPAVLVSEDLALGALSIHVAQGSDRFGLGPFRSLSLGP